MKPGKLVGLTGACCAGKNHVALILEQRGLPVLDVDKLGHEVIETEKDRLVTRFGSDILDASGFVDRKRLGKKVFGNPGELSALEDIIHPAVNRETLAWINDKKEKACVVNAALLHRSSAFDILDVIIIVRAGFFTRLLRARKRDKLPWAALLKRFHSQRNFSSQYSAGKADIYRVENSGFSRKPEKQPENQIDKILSQLGIR